MKAASWSVGQNKTCGLVSVNRKRWALYEYKMVYCILLLIMIKRLQNMLVVVISRGIQWLMQNFQHVYINSSIQCKKKKKKLNEGKIQSKDISNHDQ